MGSNKKVYSNHDCENTNHLQRLGETDETNENRMCALAISLAEKQLREGTASSQVITHYLKLASTKDKLEKDILRSQKELMDAKRETINAQRRSEEMIAEAMEAFKAYSGHSNDEQPY